MVRPLLIIFLCSVNNSITQKLSGKVIDSSSASPIHYAHISCPETGEGTVSDENGNFNLIFNNLKKSRTLIASFVGYTTVVKSIGKSVDDYIFELSPDTTF